MVRQPVITFELAHVCLGTDMLFFCVGGGGRFLGKKIYKKFMPYLPDSQDYITAHYEFYLT